MLNTDRSLIDAHRREDERKLTVQNSKRKRSREGKKARKVSPPLHKAMADKNCGIRLGRNCSIEFIAYQPRQICRKLRPVVSAAAICPGIVLTLRLLSSRALSFRTMDRR